MLHSGLLGILVTGVFVIWAGIILHWMNGAEGGTDGDGICPKGNGEQ